MPKTFANKKQRSNEREIQQWYVWEEFCCITWWYRESQDYWSWWDGKRKGASTALLQGLHIHVASLKMTASRLYTKFQKYWTNLQADYKLQLVMHNIIRYPAVFSDYNFHVYYIISHNPIRLLLEMLIITVNIFQLFMEPRSLLPCSQESITGPYSEWNKHSPHHHTLSI